jgi:CRP/FNR family transcriptional regulator, cyclic AMP receptor protein
MKFFGADTNAQKIEMLKSIPIFHTLTRKELFEVDELLNDRTYEKGEIIFEKGESGHGIFIILSGKARVNISPEAPDNDVIELGRGEAIGLYSLFDEIPRLGTVVAAERTVTVALSRAEFSSLLTRNKNIGVKILVEIARILSQHARQLLVREKNVHSV